MTDRINFSIWNVPYGVSSNAKNALDSERAGVRDMKEKTPTRMKTLPKASALDLLDVYGELSHIQTLAMAFGTYATNDPSDIHLGADLVDVATQAQKSSMEFRAALTVLLVTEEAELAACRERTK